MHPIRDLQSGFDVHAFDVSQQRSSSHFLHTSVCVDGEQL